MAGPNSFGVLDDEAHFEFQPIVDTVSAPTLNSNALEPDESLHDFHIVARKEKRQRSKPVTTGGEEVRISSIADPEIEGPEERFSINAYRGDKFHFPKSSSDKWTNEKSADMKVHRADSKARKAEVQAHKDSIGSKGAKGRRERAAEMKARKAEAKAHKGEVRAQRDSMKKLEKEGDGKNAAKERKKLRQSRR